MNNILTVNVLHVLFSEDGEMTLREREREKDRERQRERERIIKVTETRHCVCCLSISIRSIGCSLLLTVE